MRNSPFMEVETSGGKKVQLELIDKLLVDGVEYVIVSEKGTDNANAFRVEIKNGMRDFKSIGSGPEFKKVLEAYNRNNKSL